MLFVRRTRCGSGGIADLQASLDRSCLGMCCAEPWGAAGEGEQLLLFLDNECEPPRKWLINCGVSKII